MTDNQQYIDGTWYEEEYRSGCYRWRYIEQAEPDWAKQCKAYVINHILLYLALPLSARILDLGSGVGQFMRAWQARGFQDVSGIEISQIAVLHSSMPTLKQGTVQDMPFADKEFDLVFSSALFEHIDESILDAVLKECFRVGHMQAHSLCLDAGTDPSHINIKTAEGWLDAFESRMSEQELAFIVSDELLGVSPLLIALPEDRMPYPLGRKLYNDATGNHDQQH